MSDSSWEGPCDPLGDLRRMRERMEAGAIGPCDPAISADVRSALRLLDRIAELVEDDTIFGRGLDERLDAMRAIEKLIREAKAGRWPQEKTDGG